MGEFIAGFVDVTITTENPVKNVTTIMMRVSGETSTEKKDAFLDQIKQAATAAGLDLKVV